MADVVKKQSIASAGSKMLVRDYAAPFFLALAAAFVAAPQEAIDTLVSAVTRTIPATLAASHVGETLAVEGVVSEARTARSGKATLVHIGGRFPHEAFTAVISAGSAGAVGDVSGLVGKTVDVVGTIETYEGRPGIVVTSRDQIKIR